MAKVSIIVPVYKAEEGISKCIESLVSQTFDDIEIILVDDGSPDNCGKICDEYSQKDNRIKVIHKPNGGVSSARNRGIEEATGEYILFVDSDDWVENDYVQSLVEVKNTYNDSEPVGGYRVVSDYNGTYISTVVFSSENDTSLVYLKQYMDLMGACVIQAPWNKLFRKTVIDNENIRFNEGLSLGEDAIFVLEYYSKCGLNKIRCINRPLYNYIITEKESLNTKYCSNYLEMDKLFNSELKRCITSWGADEEQMQKYHNSRFYRYVYALENTYKKGNLATEKEKRKTNGEILRSEEFKEALSKVTAHIHPIHKIAYKSGSWMLVRLAYKITSLKKYIKRK